MKTQMLWVARSKNTKTGDIPQGYVGQTRKQTRASCFGCPLEAKYCYYYKGSAQMAHGQMMEKYQEGKDYGISTAIKNSVRSANYVRAAVGGDPCVFTREEVQEWRDQAMRAGFKGMIGYTHFPHTKGSHLKGLVLASTECLTQADLLMDQGWLVAVTLPYRTEKTKRHQHLPVWDGKPVYTPAGRHLPVCPQQIQRGVNCNSCGKCALPRALNRYELKSIAFLMQ